LRSNAVKQRIDDLEENLSLATDLATTLKSNKALLFEMKELHEKNTFVCASCESGAGATMSQDGTRARALHCNDDSLVTKGYFMKYIDVIQT